MQTRGYRAGLGCFRLGGLLLAVWALGGCVADKYKAAPEKTPPPAVLNLTGQAGQLNATLNTVVVYQGPGSWKKEAYWDEYVLTLSNPGPGPVTVTSLQVVDGLGQAQACGDDPWELEKRSRENLKVFENTGKQVLIGAGVAVGWVGAGLVAGAAQFSAGAGAALGSAVGGGLFIILPIWALGSGVRTLVARSAITEEFNRRRVPLPLVIPAGQSRLGSFFFPISPGPRRLDIRGQSGGSEVVATIDLAPLAGLHLRNK